MPRAKGFNTEAVHAGEIRDPSFGNVVTPIFETATFMSPNTSRKPYIDATRNEPFIYTRWGNPTTQSLEEKYATLEGVKHGLSFSSGMAAITSAIFAMGLRGKKIMAINELYGQTHAFFSSYIQGFGMECDFISIDAANGPSFDPSGHSLMYVESITNPTMKVADISWISKVCKEHGIPLVVDATFASPFNQKPAGLGADVVVHSGTKYMAGHSDITLGLAGTSNREYYDGIQNVRKTTGPVPDPIQAYLAARGMKTLGIRMERQNRNAMEVAKFLSDHRKVSSVNYPGLKDSKYHEIASRVLRGYGGMLSFEVRGGLQAARKLLGLLKVPVVATSLGGVESLVSLPVDTSHASIDPQERKRMGIPDGLVRLSCGIEESDDIINDLDSSLSAIDS